MNPAVLERGRVPDDVVAPKSTIVTLRSGREVKLQTPSVSGLLRTLSALQASGIDRLPVSTNVTDLLSDDQRASLTAVPDVAQRAEMLNGYIKGFTQDQKDKLAENARQQMQMILSLISAGEIVIPTVISAVSELTEQQAAALDAVDGLEVLSAGLEVVDFAALVEAGMRFFSRAGALVKRVASENRAAA